MHVVEIIFLSCWTLCVIECTTCPNTCSCSGRTARCDLLQTDGRVIPDLPDGVDHVILHNWGPWTLTWNSVKHLELFDTRYIVNNPILQLRNLTSLKIYTTYFYRHFGILNAQSQFGVKELHFVGNKNLSFVDVTNFLKGSRFSALEVLVIDRISTKNDDQISTIDSDFFTELHTKKELRHLELTSLDLNNIKILGTRCPPKLQYLSLKGSVINRVKTYYRSDRRHICKTLKTFDISETHFRSVRELFIVATKYPNLYLRGGDIKLYLFEYFFNVENVIIYNYNHYPVILENVTLNTSSYKTKFRRVNLSKNNFKFINFTYISNAEHGIEEYNLSLNVIEFLSPRLLNPGDALRKLDLRSNNLYKMQRDFPSDFEILFQSYSNLTYLDLSRNGLTAIPQAMFSRNKELSHLDLGYNQLTEISFSLASCVELQYLNLRENRFLIHDVHSVGHLINLLVIVGGNDEDSNTTQRSENNLKIDLTGNSLSCSCDNIDLQAWVVENNNVFLMNVSEGYMCTFNEKAYNIITNEVRDIWKYCSQQRRLRLALAQAASGLVFIAVCLIVMFLVRRRMIRYKKMKAMLKYLQRDEFPLQFLMFLSHCSADDELFINYILPTLSQSMKEVTKTNRDYICLGDKHFRPGHTIVEEVMRCIEQSAVVVLIISNKYIKSQWCDMEAKEAATQQKPVILILTENIEQDKMSPVLKQLFNRYTRFKCFTGNGGQYEVSPTWTVLSSSVLDLATSQMNI